MKIYIGKPPKPGGPERFTIGEQMARLTDAQYKKLGFDGPLHRLAKFLKEKGPAPGDMIGIEVQGIGINFLLGPDGGDL